MFSAVGLLLADLRVDKIWTKAFRSTDVDAAEVQREFGLIAERALAELRQEGFSGEPETLRAINMRYLGQNYEHELELPDGEVTEQTLAEAFARFAEMHEQRYGYAIEGETIELVSFKVTAIGRRPQVQLVDAAPEQIREDRRRQVYFRGLGFVDTTLVHRSSLQPGQTLRGPALVQEDSSTTLVAPDMSVLRTADGSLLVEVRS